MAIEQNRTTEHEKRGRRGERDKDIELTMRLVAELPRGLVRASQVHRAGLVRGAAYVLPMYNP